MVICRIDVGDVIENLAKSEVSSRELEEDLKGSLRGDIALPTVKLATSAEQNLGSVLDTSCRR